ncbi:hypothetical protein [Acidocella sp.]|uniref:hypothetical protein n=1 Tax=Acidocella sp. TaxID=50710 RepID=UPI0026369C8C|nr:hypothetical protein [Acidocella sp.]
MSDILMTRSLEVEGTALADNPSAVNWGAVFAGGVSAAAIAAILSIFGAGLGLASVSPWRGEGVSVGAFTALAAIWLIIVQWVASFVGGYMAGRLRTKYTAIHTDEVFFRDTAHGFLAWALSVLFMVAALGAAGGTGAASGAKAASDATTALPTAYYTGLLFRQPPGGTALAGVSAPGMTEQDMSTQAGLILAEVGLPGGVPADDQAYLAQLVSEKTGLASADAQARVTDVLNRERADIDHVKRVADAARKAASGALIYGFVSLLIGGFIASVAGAVGGRLRDNY